MISKSFIKSSLVYTLIGSLPLATSLILLPFYGNRTLLSTSDFGLLAIFILLSELARVLFTFSTDNFIGLNYIHYSDSKTKREAFLGTSTLFMLIYGGGMLLLFATLGDQLFSALYPDKGIDFYPYGLLSIATGLFNGIFKSYTTLQIYREKPTPYFWSNLLHFTLVIGISIAGLYLKPLSLQGPIWGRFIGATVTFLWALIYYIRNGKFSIDYAILKRLLSYSAPLYLYNILYWIISNIDRYYILGIMSERAVAIFDFAVKLTMAMEFIQNGLAGAISPKIFKLWKKSGDKPEGNIEINRYFHTYTLLNILALPLYYLSIPLLVPLVVNNSDLYIAFSFLPLLFAGRAIRVWYYYLSTPVYFFRKTRIMPIVFGITAAIQVGLTYMLIKYYGITGAVWGNFLTKAIQVSLMYLMVKQFYRFNVNHRKMVVFPALYIATLMVCHLFFSGLPFFITGTVQLLVVVAGAAYIYRNELNYRSIIQAIKKR